ncbi:hypothetical protein [Hydrogenophaga sp. ZJX-1]|uniref:hypothetical protein n=1 Tax=Hydrogenophaga sp. ZJX-1 TaxID=3404778 RepID=UPI003B28C53C
MPGRFRMFFSGTPGAGAVSLNTLLPEASIHSHCAGALLQAKTVKAASANLRTPDREEIECSI